MNEFDLIARLTQNLPQNGATVVGVGDDCAVLDIGMPGRELLFKTDAVVEGIHFTREIAPEKIGHKAMARCLSDIAAMGGTPGSAVITLALPKEHDVAWVEAVYGGMNTLAGRHQVAIVGGETTTNPERVLISIAMIGHVEKGRAVLRSGARAGDAIFVSGELGGSIAGRHLEFEPRLAEARWLAAHFPIHAMIDVSDGLAGDLRHILERSGVGADLMGQSIPVSRAAKLRARESTLAKPALLAALTDGEDFELLFTVASQQAVPLLDAWKAQFSGVKLTCIGKISAGPGLRLRDERGVRELTAEATFILREAMTTVISRSPEETAALGEAWGRDAAAGLVIGLRGDLGAGKTQWVKGLARGLGITTRISSPTFALVNEYREGRLPLFHLDLYRLDHEAQIVGAGLESYLFEPQGVAVVEWIERWLGREGRDAKRPARFLDVLIEHLADHERRITYENFGA